MINSQKTNFINNELHKNHIPSLLQLPAIYFLPAQGIANYYRGRRRLYNGEIVPSIHKTNFQNEM
jgi:hypothetical protein